MIKLLDAIFAIDPKAEVTFHEEDIDSLKWDSTPIPKDTILAKQTELQAEYDALDYARKRKAEYPTIEELVVALYDTDDKAAIDEKRAAVKLKYLKP